jgi:hypothetical protein
VEAVAAEEEEAEAAEGVTGELVPPALSDSTAGGFSAGLATGFTTLRGSGGGAGAGAAGLAAAEGLTLGLKNRRKSMLPSGGGVSTGQVVEVGLLSLVLHQTGFEGMIEV